jgi:hypothetical protein
MWPARRVDGHGTPGAGAEPVAVGAWIEEDHHVIEGVLRGLDAMRRPPAAHARPTPSARRRRPGRSEVGHHLAPSVATEAIAITLGCEGYPSKQPVHAVGVLGKRCQRR